MRRNVHTPLKYLSQAEFSDKLNLSEEWTSVLHIRHFATNSMIRLVGIQKVTPTINKKGKNQRKEGKVSFMGQHIRYNGFKRKTSGCGADICFS